MFGTDFGRTSAPNHPRQYHSSLAMFEVFALQVTVKIGNKITNSPSLKAESGEFGGTLPIHWISRLGPATLKPFHRHPEQLLHRYTPNHLSYINSCLSADLLNRSGLLFGDAPVMFSAIYSLTNQDFV